MDVYYCLYTFGSYKFIVGIYYHHVQGVVLKFNANQRYATTAITAAILREVASRGGVPMQEVIVRNDSHCGSTIGPMMSANLLMRTVGEWT